MMLKKRLCVLSTVILAAALQISGCGTAHQKEAASGSESAMSSAADNGTASSAGVGKISSAVHASTAALPEAEGSEETPATSGEEGPESAEESSLPAETGSALLSPEEVSALPAGTHLTDDQIEKDRVGNYFTSSAIAEGDAVYFRIYGKSWRENPDIALSDLRYLRTLIVNFDGNTETGEMIVNASIADDVLKIFCQLYTDGYQIRKMHLVDDYWTGDGASTDEASMQDDNTSAFNYRMTTSGRSLSNHALGHAIDLNPLENPYIYTSGDGSVSVSPANAANVYERSGSHVITESDEAYTLFTGYGFTWGGSWTNPKDYQHFEK